MLSVAAADLVWDSGTQGIYLAVPEVSTLNSSTVSLLDPTSGRIVAQASVGETPGRLALSNDRQFLYAGLAGSGTVRRLSLPALQTTQTFTLDPGPSGRPYYAIQIAPMPGNSRTIAVVRGDRDGATRGVGGVAIYDDATRRPDIFDGEVINAIAWTPDDSTIYGTNVEVSSRDFTRLNVGPNGVSLHTRTRVGFLRSAVSVAMVDGLLYANGGEVMEPAEARPIGRFVSPATGLLVPPDVTRRIAFVLFPDLNAADPNDTFIIQSYDADRYTRIASIRLTGIRAGTDGFPTAFIRWGDRGLAFATIGGRVFLLDGGFVTSTIPDAATLPSVTTLTTGTSANGAVFTLKRINVAAKDLVFDRTRGLLYQSLSAGSSFNPNSVTAFDPRTEQFTGATYVGSEPDALAISGDDAYVYVGLEAASSVRRVRLADLTADIESYIGRDEQHGAYEPNAIAVAPGSAVTFAVTRRRQGGISPAADGVAIFDGRVQRPKVGGNLTPGGYLNGPLTSVINWGADATTLYAANTDTSLLEFSVFSVDAEGVTHQRNTNTPVNGVGGHFYYHSGLIYLDGGSVYDPAVDLERAKLELGFGDETDFAVVAIDSDLRKLFYLKTTYPSGGRVVYKIDTFDMDTYAPIDSMEYFPDSPASRIFLTRFLRWGTDGLVFLNTRGELYLLTGEFVNARP